MTSTAATDVGHFQFLGEGAAASVVDVRATYSWHRQTGPRVPAPWLIGLTVGALVFVARAVIDDFGNLIQVEQFR